MLFLIVCRPVVPKLGCTLGTPEVPFRPPMPRWHPIPIILEYHGAGVWPQHLNILGDFNVQLTLGMAIVFLFQHYPLMFSLFISLSLNRKMQEKFV